VLLLLCLANRAKRTNKREVLVKSARRRCTPLAESLKLANKPKNVDETRRKARLA